MEPTQPPMQSPARSSAQPLPQPSAQPLPQPSAQPLTAPAAGAQPQAPAQRAANPKTAKIIAGILAVIAVAGIALGVYGVLTGQSKDQQISDLKTQLEEAKEEENNNKCVATISLEDVRALLSKYLVFDYFVTAAADTNVFENGLTEQYKYYLSLKNLNYTDRITTNQEEGLDAIMMSVYDFTYDELNDSYHSLFGSASDLQNQEGWCGVPFFFQEYNKYVAYGGCGGFDPSAYTYGILNYYTQDDELMVDVAYFRILQESVDGELKTYMTVGGSEEELVGNKIFDILQENIDKFPKYELKFTKENGNYILSAVNQI